MDGEEDKYNMKLLWQILHTLWEMSEYTYCSSALTTIGATHTSDLSHWRSLARRTCPRRAWTRRSPQWTSPRRRSLWRSPGGRSWPSLRRGGSVPGGKIRNSLSKINKTFLLHQRNGSGHHVLPGAGDQLRLLQRPHQDHRRGELADKVCAHNCENKRYCAHLYRTWNVLVWINIWRSSHLNMTTGHWPASHLFTDWAFKTHLLCFVVDWDLLNRML